MRAKVPEQNAKNKRIAIAESICGSRGTQLTKVRREVLELLWQSARPAGAYELIDLMKRKARRPIGPPTVYRALEFLMSQGLVSRIESRNAYVACTYPERQHDCVFFLCSECGVSIELDDQRLAYLITQDARHIGFKPSRQVIEVVGRCTSCVSLRD